MTPLQAAFAQYGGKLGGAGLMLTGLTGVSQSINPSPSNRLTLLLAGLSSLCLGVSMVGHTYKQKSNSDLTTKVGAAVMAADPHIENSQAVEMMKDVGLHGVAREIEKIDAGEKTGQIPIPVPGHPEEN